MFGLSCLLRVTTCIISRPGMSYQGRIRKRWHLKGFLGFRVWGYLRGQTCLFATITAANVTLISQIATVSASIPALLKARRMAFAGAREKSIGSRAASSLTTVFPVYDSTVTGTNSCLKRPALQAFWARSQLEMAYDSCSALEIWSF